MNKLKIKGFTLVELIIVITILVILATIAFVSFNSYTKTARDSSRITTIKNISKGIDSFFIKTGNVPNVDNQSSTGYIGSDNLSYVGNIGENITNLIGMGEIPKDPLTGSNYVYGIDVNKKKYQIGGVIEDGVVSKVEGNYNGLLKNGGKIYNIPSLIFTGSGNLIGTGTYYIIEGGKNIAYSLDNKELTNTETGLTTLKILTNNQNVTSITGITIPSTLTGYTLSGSEYSAILGYTKDTIGISIFGNQYLTSSSSGSNTNNVASLGTVHFSSGSINYQVMPSGCPVGIDNNPTCSGNDVAPRLRTTARDYCDNLILNGFSDWRLPNLYELGVMYNNKNSIGGFSTTFPYNYWSKDLYNSPNLYSIIYFANGAYSYDNNIHYVRCIRTF